MILSDTEILALCKEGMIIPYETECVRSVDGRGVISYGSSSFGYDIRLSSVDFQVFRRDAVGVTNPKAFDPNLLVKAPLRQDEWGEFFVIPAHSYGLGVAMERLQIPPDVTVVCVGKSTYARAGIIANVTPGEAGWCGHLTLEFSNSSGSDCRIYAGEGVLQLLFFRGQGRAAVSYDDRAGKYQNQGEKITWGKV